MKMQTPDLSSSWVHQKCSSIGDEKSKYPKNTFTKVLGNGDAEKAALAYFSSFQISERVRYIYEKLGLPVFYKIIPC